MANNRALLADGIQLKVAICGRESTCASIWAQVLFYLSYLRNSLQCSCWRKRYTLKKVSQENFIRCLQGFVILAVSGAKPLHCGNEYIVIAALPLELL